MKQKLFITTFLLIVSLSNLSAQTSMPNVPHIIPPTPQAAQHLRYGEIPVGHTTGVPDIEIPLYSLDTGWMQLPITLNCHPSGFKVSDIPSPAGLGWVVNVAGYMITRSIEESPDMDKDSIMQINSASQIDSLKSGSKQYIYAERGWDFSNYNNWMNWNRFLIHVTGNTYPISDTRSDRYYYSYPKGNGVARYDFHSKKLLPVPYTPEIIQRKSATSYLIVDDAGIRYEFSYPEYSTITDMGKSAVGFYLTRITDQSDPEHPIEFSYRDGTSYFQISKRSTINIVDSRLIPSCNGSTAPSPACNIGMSYQSETYQSPLLSEIKWRDTSIKFNYTTDRKDRRKERLSSIHICYNNNLKRVISLDNNSYFGKDNNSYRLKLKSVKISGPTESDGDEVYSFNYYKEDEIAPPYYGIQDIVNCCEDFWGYYNGTNSTFNFPSDVDWKKALGITSSDVTHFAPFQEAESYIARCPSKMPSENYSKYYMLQDIIYPTKGKSTLIYELNNITNTAYEFSSNKQVGGLRLKSRINYNDENDNAERIDYQYSGRATRMIKNSYFAINRPVVDYYGCLVATNPDRYALSPITYQCKTLIDHSASNLTDWTGSNVFYDNVREIVSKGIESWTNDYYYTQNAPNINDECHFNIDDYLPNMISEISDCDKGSTESILLREVNMNANGDTVRFINNHYTNYPIIPVRTGVRIWHTVEHPANSFLNPGGMSFQKILDISTNKQSVYQTQYMDYIKAINTYAFRDQKLLTSTTITEYSEGKPVYADTTQYDYACLNGCPYILTPTTEIKRGSRGEENKIERFYSFSPNYCNTQPFAEMKDKNMLSQIVEENNILNGKKKGEKIVYAKNSQTQNRILPVKELEYVSEANAFRDYVSIDKYDNYGNVLQTTASDGTSTTYLWSYNGTYPTIEIKGAKYNEVISALKITPSTIISYPTLITPENTTSIFCNMLRNNLPSCMVTGYQYNPLIGISTIILPNGTTYRYVYDQLGRIIRGINQKGKTVDGYYYEYKQ